MPNIQRETKEKQVKNNSQDNPNILEINSSSLIIES